MQQYIWSNDSYDLYFVWERGLWADLEKGPGCCTQEVFWSWQRRAVWSPMERASNLSKEHRQNGGYGRTSWKAKGHLKRSQPLWDLNTFFLTYNQRVEKFFYWNRAVLTKDQILHLEFSAFQNQRFRFAKFHHLNEYMLVYYTPGPIPL